MTDADYLVVEVGSGADSLFHRFAGELTAQNRHGRSSIDRDRIGHFLHPDSSLVDGVQVANELTEVHAVGIGVVHSDLMTVELKNCVLNQNGQFMNIFCEVPTDLLKLTSGHQKNGQYDRS